MATFLLVHGAWLGGWCYKRVARLLRGAGHDVYTPTLTGLGERAHLLSPSISFKTHIADVLGVIQWEELSDIVLCGHSYAGTVISGVAEKAVDRIGALVFIDAFSRTWRPFHPSTCNCCARTRGKMATAICSHPPPPMASTSMPPM
jgi:pimeloyl-ACP methyl ester carboxylesterase